MKKQGRQLNILNGLFLKNTKEQEEKVLSAEIQKSQVDSKDKKETLPVSQREVEIMLGRNSYSSGLRTYKQLLEKYLKRSEKYSVDLGEYKKAYLKLNSNLKDFNLLSQKIADKKQNYNSEMIKYEEVKKKYEQSLKEYQEITKEYENDINDSKAAQKKFEENSLALKNINDEVQNLIDKKSVKNDAFIEIKEKLAVEQEEFKAADDVTVATAKRFAEKQKEDSSTLPLNELNLPRYASSDQIDAAVAQIKSIVEVVSNDKAELDSHSDTYFNSHHPSPTERPKNHVYPKLTEEV